MVKSVCMFKGGPTRPHTLLLGFAISKTTKDIFMQQLARERSWASQLACTIWCKCVIRSACALAWIFYTKS